MGVNNHNAVIATTCDQEEVERIKKFIKPLEHSHLFLIGEPKINNYTTVVLIPDGSKEGWEASNIADELRDLFIEELKKADYEDGSNPWKWVEVGFGEYGQKIVRGNCKNMYGDDEYAQ